MPDEGYIGGDATDVPSDSMSEGYIGQRDV